MTSEGVTKVNHDRGALAVVMGALYESRHNSYYVNKARKVLDALEVCGFTIVQNEEPRECINQLFIGEEQF